jgi:hypothetical protein
MDTLFYLSIGISAASLLAAGTLKLYAIAYQRGYDAGYEASERCGLCGFREIREPYRSYTRDAVGV